MKKQDEGFTLIELLIVIVILGILATVVVFAVQGIRDSGDESACEAELRSVLTGIEAYYAENGFYPPADDGQIEAEYFRTNLQYWTYGTDGVVTPDSTVTDNPAVDATAAEPCVA